MWCGKLKTESTRKLSNFYFQWGKTLYQNNLTNIAFFFTFFEGLRCNKKSSVVTPKKISHGRQRKWMSNFTRYVIAQVLKILKISCVKCYNSVKFDIHFLGLPWEIFFGVTTDHLLHQALEECKKECNMLYFKLNYPGTRFLSTENKNYSMSWWILFFSLWEILFRFFASAEYIDASEGKKFRWIEVIHFSEYLKQFLEVYSKI